MAKKRESRARAAAKRDLGEILLREGQKVRRARRRRRLTQAALGARVGVAQSTISQLERGEGGTLSLILWKQVTQELDLAFDPAVGRDPLEAPGDAGHLDVQELVLGLGRGQGYLRSYELPTKPSNPSLSVDVGLADDQNRRLLQIECVNVFGKVNAAVRSSDRKRAEAEMLAAVTGDGAGYTVHQCWVIRATRRNRALIARYPHIFATAFPGSSKAWVQALTRGGPPPAERGLVWCDVRATRVFEWRQPHLPRNRPEH